MSFIDVKTPWRWSSKDRNMLEFWCVISENTLILTYMHLLILLGELYFLYCKACEIFLTSVSSSINIAESMYNCTLKDKASSGYVNISFRPNRNDLTACWFDSTGWCSGRGRLSLYCSRRAYANNLSCCVCGL
jgi:hypothetical protein